MFYFQLKKKKKKKKNRDRDFSIISVGRERAIKQVFFLGLSLLLREVTYQIDYFNNGHGQCCPFRWVASYQGRI